MQENIRIFKNKRTFMMSIRIKYCTRWFSQVYILWSFNASLEVPDNTFSTMRQRDKSESLPANLIFNRSNGCSRTVDVTPPVTPATRCSYFTCLKSVIPLEWFWLDFILNRLLSCHNLQLSCSAFIAGTGEIASSW